jgi:hypothetical protein
MCDGETCAISLGSKTERIIILALIVACALSAESCLHYKVDVLCTSMSQVIQECDPLGDPRGYYYDREIKRYRLGGENGCLCRKNFSPWGALFKHTDGRPPKAQNPSDK